MMNVKLASTIQSSKDYDEREVTSTIQSSKDYDEHEVSINNPK